MVPVSPPTSRLVRLVRDASWPAIAAARVTLAALVAIICLGAGLPAAVRAVVDLPDGFEDEEVAVGVIRPVGLAFLPDGRMLAIEHQQSAPHETEGQVQLIVGGTVVEPPVLVIDSVLVGNERGLLGVAVDPGWPDRPYAYFYFNHLDGYCALRMYTATGDLNDPSSTDLSFTSPYNILTDIPDETEYHQAGTLRFGSDGMLYVSTGDDASSCAAADSTTLLGTILRLDVSALPGAGSGPPDKSLITPPDNPFPGPDPNARLAYCFGLRNPYHFSIDRVTGKLYIGDVGNASWEELDEAAGGEYFGWPRREGAHPGTLGGACPGDPGVDPIWEYPHPLGPASIIGGPLYRPAPGGGVHDFPPEYDGDVFYVEHYEGTMHRLTFDAGSGTWGLADPVPGQPAPDVWATGITRVADIQVGPDGAIYYAQVFPGPIRRIVSTATAAVGEGRDVPVAKPHLAFSPNPVRAGVASALRYVVSRPGRVSIDVYTVAGTHLLELWSGHQ
ncbi:MAG: PQQ-dependent sugar dehydrogenase, partial [Candidatus Eiseniibacteriota bacterium]